MSLILAPDRRFSANLGVDEFNSVSRICIIPTRGAIVTKIFAFYHKIFASVDHGRLSGWALPRILVGSTITRIYTSLQCYLRHLNYFFYHQTCTPKCLYIIGGNNDCILLYLLTYCLLLCFYTFIVLSCRK